MELIQGKYYYAEHSIDNYVIFQASAQGTGCAEGVRYKSEYYKNNSWAIKKETIRLATEKEIEWLCECRQTGKYITPSQLLGETEEYKAGDWVVITTFQGGSDKGSVVKLIQADYYLTYKNNAGTVLSATPECIRLARPEEIPQEEVEYVECISSDGEPAYNYGRVYKVSEYYNEGDHRRLKTTLDDVGSDTNGWRVEYFKPSTREAYEAQQKREEFKVHIEATNNLEQFKGLFKELEKVNKCSTINTNQNECKNENKSIKVQRSGISISRSSRARGKGLCSSGGKISLGTYYSRNKQKPCSGKA